MPLAFILVLMIAVGTGFYEADNHIQQQEAKLHSESSAVASNMLSYQRYINAVVKFQDAAGQVPNYPFFQTFTGDAQTFIDQARGRGALPPAGFMSWYKGPMPGVSAWIQGGKTYLQYQPTDATMASQQGVQRELLKLTRGSYGVGKAVAP